MDTSTAKSGRSAVQPALFDVQPLVSIEHIPHESLDERFSRWIKANPHILTTFIRLAEEVQARGRRKVGAKLLVERLRWEYLTRTSGDEFRLNNSFTSRLARAAVKKVPRLADLFEFRELRS